MMHELEELKRRLAEISDIESAAALLGWDQTTYMPTGGAAARGRQIGTLRRIAHEKMTAPEIGRLLEELQTCATSLAFDSDEASLIRVVRREYERAANVPAAFVEELSNLRAASYAAWEKARPQNDLTMVLPFLEKMVDQSRRYSGFFAGHQHVADPLIDIREPGMTVATVRPVFSELRERLLPIVDAVAALPPADDACLRQSYPESQQRAFGRQVITRFGYDFRRGREDKSAHPYTTKFSLDDVRITTRVDPGYLGSALFSTLHEAGHGMYEQGINPAFEGTPLARGASSAVHESQSRLWENIVGRSRPFWRFHFPELQRMFGCQLGRVDFDTFYRAINKVQRSLIRTGADEVTYNLHVMIRFDLELDLLEGRMAFADLPTAWNERYQSDLGITPPHHGDGVLQDMHWFSIFVGGVFQGYTLGNVSSAQFFEAASTAHPEIDDEMAHGEFRTLYCWLQDHIYQHGRKFTALELLERVTGGALNVSPYIRYLKAKYSDLYTL